MFDPNAPPRTEEELDRLPRMRGAAATTTSDLRRMLNVKMDLESLPDLDNTHSPPDQTSLVETSLPPDSESFRLVRVSWDS